MLVADDEMIVVDLLSKMLAQHFSPLTIQKSLDGYEALLKAGEFKPDLLILDANMPGLDGAHVIRVVRGWESGRFMKILGISGFPHLLEEMTMEGADLVMLKPFHMDEMIEKIRELLLPLPLNGEPIPSRTLE